MDKSYLIIGDSHVSGFVSDNQIISINEIHKNENFHALHIGPRTLYKIQNKIDLILNVILNYNELSTIDNIIISLGEIDIRSHFYNEESEKIDLIDLINNLKLIESCLLSYEELKSKKIIYYSPIAPIHHESELASKDLCNIHGSYKDRLKTLLKFNELLFFYGISFYNPLPKTITTEEYLDPSKTFDGLHLNYETMKIIKSDIKRKW